MQDGKWGIVSFEGKEILKPANGKPIISDEMLYGAQWLCFGDDKAFYTLNTSGEFTRRNKQNFFKEYGILTTQGIMDLKSRPTHCSMAISIAERLTKIFHSTLITPAQAP